MNIFNSCDHRGRHGRFFHHDGPRGAFADKQSLHGGRCGAGGPGRRGERMERGALRFVLLDALSDGPKHGYEIIKALEERTHGQWVPSAGAVYPALQYLNDLDLVRDFPEGDRRVYELTAEGRTELAAQAERVEAFWSRFAAEPPSPSSQHEVEFLQEELEDLSKTIWRGLRSAIGAGDRDAIRQVRAVVERSRNEVRDLIAVGAATSQTGME
ncbi:MAG: PadR family transcriptional regulator [Capsulimonas sp.]|uniref:PadR family transcriptional regulator n=1 Tax=Capsulimonas sp. TaxID=2494211 RepID=UPI0032676278